MNLAEALAERKMLQTRISEINQRLQNVALVQEGDQPLEDPNTLLAEVDEITKRLTYLIGAINRTNLATLFSETVTITGAIAQRDMLKVRLGVYDAFLRASSIVHHRTRGAEIKMVPTTDVSKIQRERDTIAMDYRVVDMLLQSANWTTDLIK